jgi:hypothetical protein
VTLLLAQVRRILVDQVPVSGDLGSGKVKGT